MAARGPRPGDWRDSPRTDTEGFWAFTTARWSGPSPCSLLGMLPLILAGGASAELRRPLGISVAGRLMVSQLLTLYTAPVVYLYFDRFRVRRGNRYNRCPARRHQLQAKCLLEEAVSIRREVGTHPVAHSLGAALRMLEDHLLDDTSSPCHGPRNGTNTRILLQKLKTPKSADPAAR